MNSREEEIFSQFESLKPELKNWGEMVDGILIDTIMKDMINEHLIKILPSYRL